MCLVSTAFITCSAWSGMTHGVDLVARDMLDTLARDWEKADARSLARALSAKIFVSGGGLACLIPLVTMTGFLLSRLLAHPVERLNQLEIQTAPVLARTDSSEPARWLNHVETLRGVSGTSRTY